MPRTTLLHREASTKSLKTIVENAQRQRPPSNGGYDIDIRGGQLVLTGPSSSPTSTSPPSHDEGFESDVDSVSLLSTDDSFTAKSQETDSANGSACSDSEGESGATRPSTTVAPEERFNLVNCVCYADIKYPDVLVFAIADEALVFRFDSADELRHFHANFNTVKAVSNQRAYSSVAPTTFNLLQRTDSNGVTHIEISRPTSTTKQRTIALGEHSQPSSIISISTPDYEAARRRSLSTENLLDSGEPLRKVWSSAENLLDAEPRKVQLRRRPKGPAPPPPPVLQGQYVRVNVQPRPQPPIFRPLMLKTVQTPPTPTTWTSSMPRLLRKPKNFFRYVDHHQPPPPRHGGAQTIADRLFGMSAKLKEFGSTQAGCNVDGRYQQVKDARRREDGALKSVIKKDDAKRKNEKKVTFSAYNTVQVV